jgi:hypothetical protein
MLHALIFEMRRVGLSKAEIKTELLKWNQRNGTLKKTEGDARRELIEYVNWFFSKNPEPRLGCKALEAYCNDQCSFKISKSREPRILPFNLTEAEIWLERECKPHGYLMGKLIICLWQAQREKGNFETVWIGCREIAAKLLENGTGHLDPKDVLRCLNRLEEQGFIQIIRGKSGSIRRQANGYKFLPWKPTLGVLQHTTHNTHMCGNVPHNNCVANPPEITPGSHFIKERKKALQVFLEKNGKAYTETDVERIEPILTKTTNPDELLQNFEQGQHQEEKEDFDDEYHKKN